MCYNQYMKKFTIISVLALFVFSILGFGVNNAEAKTSYYKSAKTGRFTTKSYSSSHKSTTYKSYYR